MSNGSKFFNKRKQSDRIKTVLASNEGEKTIVLLHKLAQKELANENDFNALIVLHIPDQIHL